MSTQNDNGFRTFLASGGISAFLAVDVQVDGTIKAAAGGPIQGIGVLQQDVADAGYGQVKLWTAPGTFLGALTAVALATPGNAIAVVTGGYFGIYTATTFPRIGVALTSAVAASGTVVEVAIPPTGRIVT